jgi:hypothetical protein
LAERWIRALRNLRHSRYLTDRILIHNVTPKVLDFSFLSIVVFRKMCIALLFSYYCSFDIFIIDLNHIRFLVLAWKVWTHWRLYLIVVTHWENVFIFTFNASEAILTFIFVLSKQKLIILILWRFWDFYNFFQQFDLLVLFIFLSLSIFHIVKTQFYFTFLRSLIIN